MKMSSFVCASLIYFTLNFATTRTEDLAYRLTKSNNNLGAKLYNVLLQQNENIVFSPWSIHAILYLLESGASETTADIIEKTLEYPKTNEAVDAYKSLIESMSNWRKGTLNFTNKIYVAENIDISDEYRNFAIENFKCHMESIDFSHRQEAANLINTWVEEKTDHKIHDLMSVDTIDESTHLLIVNVIYLNALWLYKFEQSQKQQFYVSENVSVDCRMMTTTQRFEYLNSTELDAAIVRVPFKDTSASFTIILPNLKTGLSDLEQKLNGTTLFDIRKNLKFHKVVLNIPRFKIVEAIDFKNPLIELDLLAIFQSTMFPRITKSSVEVSHIKQKVMIRVDEHGVEAAAASFSGQTPLRAQSHTGIIFNVDHPFIFYIESSIGKYPHVLFQGKLSNPIKRIVKEE